jgi:hypothetical protein
MRLKDNHTWKAPSGYKIVVLERGAVSFNVPTKWIVAKTQPFELNDAEPPNDNARISVSYWQFPPEIDWKGLPLEGLLIQSTNDLKMEILERSEVFHSDRKDIEIVWVQHRFLDPKEKREAFTRILVGRAFGVHVLVTCDFWVDDAKKLKPVWDEILRSLQLGRYIADPLQGETTQ